MQEEAGVVLPHKTVPLRATPGEVGLEETPGKPLIAKSLHLQRLSLRDEPGENSG